MMMYCTYLTMTNETTTYSHGKPSEGVCRVFAGAVLNRFTVFVLF